MNKNKILSFGLIGIISILLFNQCDKVEKDFELLFTNGLDQPVEIFIEYNDNDQTLRRGAFLDNNNENTAVLDTAVTDTVTTINSNETLVIRVPESAAPDVGIKYVFSEFLISQDHTVKLVEDENGRFYEYLIKIFAAYKDSKPFHIRGHICSPIDPNCK